MEAVKVRVQTRPGFARGLSDGLLKFAKAEGYAGLYKGIIPLWGRQIPWERWDWLERWTRKELFQMETEAGMLSKVDLFWTSHRVQQLMITNSMKRDLLIATLVERSMSGRGADRFQEMPRKSQQALLKPQPKNKWREVSSVLSLQRMQLKLLVLMLMCFLLSMFLVLSLLISNQKKNRSLFEHLDFQSHLEKWCTLLTRNFVSNSSVPPLTIVVFFLHIAI